MKVNPDDARAHYYLGNLYYDHQPDRALSLWEQAAQLEPGLAIVRRNLGWAYARSGEEAEKAIEQEEKRLERDRKRKERDRKREQEDAAKKAAEKKKADDKKAADKQVADRNRFR